MLNLFILRHATTEMRGTDGTDASRRLTDKGWDEIRRVGRTFAAPFRMLDAICHSPRLRARETAHGLASQIGREDLLVAADVLDCGGGLEAQVAFVEDLEREGRQCVAWIAHEPEVSNLTSWFLGLDAVRVAFDPATVAHLEFLGRPRRGGALLRAFVPPVLGRG